MTNYQIINIQDYPGRHTQNAVSPFRYPGGKAFLSGYLQHHISQTFSGVPVTFVEPFCGGAGAAMNLLADGAVERLILNDADPKIYSAWRAMLMEGARFIDAIMKTPLDVDEWYRQSEIAEADTSGGYSFDVGFAAFFINRTTRSGIVAKSGPIGGYDQSGKWKIDARFNREGLSRRVEWIAENAYRIEIVNNDALSFLDRLRRRESLDNTFFFIDPPYVHAGGRLYLNAMNEAKHVALSDMLANGSIKNWVLTYDDHELIREIYSSQSISKIMVNYSLQNKRKEHEVFIQPVQYA